MLEKQIDQMGNTFKNDKEEMKVHEIRMAMVDRMKQRKIKNKSQLNSYKKLCEYIRTREARMDTKNKNKIKMTDAEEAKATRNKMVILRLEINLLEVIKKIVEIGWIITETEMQQILSFANVTSEMINSKECLQQKKFIEKILEVFELP